MIRLETGDKVLDIGEITTGGQERHQEILIGRAVMLIMLMLLLMVMVVMMMVVLMVRVM